MLSCDADAESLSAAKSVQSYGFKNVRTVIQNCVYYQRLMTSQQAFFHVRQCPADPLLHLLVELHDARTSVSMVVFVCLYICLCLCGVVFPVFD